MVDGADLKALLVAADQPRLLPAVPRRAAAHHRGLHEDARAAVGVGSVLGVDGGEGDGVLVVLAEVEVAREPRLDAAVLADKLDELAALLLVRVVEPAAPVDHVVLLEDTQARPVWGGVGEDEDLPAVGGGVLLEHLLEPHHLGIVDGHLVRGVLGVPEDGRAEPNEKRLLGDQALELRVGLVVLPEEHLEVGRVRVELVQTLEVMVASDDLVRHAEGPEVLGRHLVALGGAGEELRGLGGTHRLGLAEITERHHCHVSMLLLGGLEGGHPLLPARLVVLHLPGVDVKVPEHPDGELVRRHEEDGRSPGLTTTSVPPKVGERGSLGPRGENGRSAKHRGDCRHESRSRGRQKRHQRQRHEHLVEDLVARQSHCAWVFFSAD
mmetsp:Transcript_16554/g.32656  ORF Transcript_16554/g.32656 Transcript_16554/m.32656 type:complete len:381 (+) Transcript_16554:1173-2315(+)